MTATHHSILVVGKRLVELSDELRDVLFVPVGDVARRPHLQLCLGNTYTSFEGHLRPVLGLWCVVPAPTSGAVMMELRFFMSMSGV